MATLLPLPVPRQAGAYAIGEGGYAVVQPPQAVANLLAAAPPPVRDDLIIPSPEIES